MSEWNSFFIYVSSWAHITTYKLQTWYILVGFPECIQAGTRIIPQFRPWPFPSTFHFIIHSKHTTRCHLIWFTLKHPVQPHAWQSAHWFMHLTSVDKYINWHVSLFQTWSLVNFWRVGPVLLFHFVLYVLGLGFLVVMYSCCVTCYDGHQYYRGMCCYCLKVEMHP